MYFFIVIDLTTKLYYYQMVLLRLIANGVAYF